MMKFDAEGRVQDYTFILSLRNHDHLGQIRNIDPDSVVSKINMNGANELSFTVYKEDNGDVERLWDEITDFKFVYVKELNEYYEIIVDNNDEESLYKSVTGTSACEMELSQTYVYDLEINTELDIARTDYTSPTVFYDPLKPEASLLHRALYKLPQYSIKYVDASLMSIQRTFSASGTDVYSFLTGDVAQEIGCLFTFDTTDRSISVYDLQTYCVDCGHRGEFSDVCPECGSTSLKYYGEDTTIYVDTENLAESVNLTVDTESVKNCFKLEAGDDNMTAAVRNLNPNGSDYIYYFSEEQKHDMPDELVAKLDSYDALVASYEEEYEQVMADMYEAIDKIIYYTSGMMPTQEDDPTNATLEAAKLTEAEMSPMSITTVTSSTSTATVNAALKNYAKVFVKSGYFKIDINEGEFNYEGTDADGNGYGYWYGSFKITNYSDDEDVAISETIRIEVNTDFDTFMDQKIKKKLALDSEEDGSIFDVLSIEDLDKFKEALTYYGLNRLTSFHDAVQGCLDIMIEMDQGRENADLYQTMYTPYYNKLLACQEEIDKRQVTIDEWGDALDAAEQRRNEIQEALNFEAYLGTELYKVFCMYKREDKYSNENYISDGLENDEIFENARQFLDVAKAELVKSGEHQRRISSTLANLLCMPEFEPIKDKFQVGNFIRAGIDNKVYKLRLISYQISFSSIQNIDVEFSDVDKIRDGMSDLQSVLNQASSMASSYGATVRQVESSKKQTDFVGNFVARGFDATAVKIVNNAQDEEIVMSDSGLLARRKDEFYEKYDDTQLKLMSTGVYVTDNAWRTVKSCIGKYYYTDPETGELVEAYGLLAESIVGQLILGNELGIYSSDGSSQMIFNNYGLVLNAIDDGSGVYKRILDIQKTDADGNTTSQLYIDTEGNIVLATDQMIQVVEQINQLNAEYANIEKLYVSNATIRELLAEYATIENLNATNAEIENLKAVDVEITGKLEAAEADIGELEADNATIHGKLTASEAEIDELKTTKLDAGEFTAYKAEVENLFADYAKIEYVDAEIVETEKLIAEKADITDLDAANAKIDNLVAKDAEIENLVATKATIEDLNATNATIENLNADLIKANEIIATKVDADYVDAEIVEANKILADEIAAKYVTIETLEADYATIKYVDAEIVAAEELIATKATIEDLEAAEAKIGVLDADVANITSIMAGNVGTGLLQTIHLTAQNMVVDDAVITNAMIADLSADKLSVGTIDTDEITIQSTDGSMVLQGSLQQFKDENGTTRIQIGKDANGDFTFVLYDEAGTGVLIDSSGVQSSDALADGLIVDSKVADNAAIQGSKLDIDSVITEINDNGSTTISSTKIWIDEENQSLGAKFDSITTSVEQATSTSNTALSTANSATSTANAATSTANQAKETADTANATANTALDTANNADANATDALNQSNTNATAIETLTETVSTKVDQTDFVVEQGRIDSLIKETETINTKITEIEGDVSTVTSDLTTLTDKYNETAATVEGNKTTIANVSTTVDNLSGEVTEMDSRITTVEETANGVKTTVTSNQAKWDGAATTADAAMSMAEQNADKISWVVESGTDATNFTLTSRTAELTADYINLNGLVTFTGLSSGVQETINNINDIASSNQTIINAWTSDAIVEGTTTINGGYIKSNTINTDHLIVDEIFATGSAAMNIINAQEINADRITSGTIGAKFLSLYGLAIYKQDTLDSDTLQPIDTSIETFYIDNNGEVSIRGSIESYNYVSGRSGWTINPEGNTEFNDVIVRGSVITNDGGIVSSGGVGTNLLNDSAMSGSIAQWTNSDDYYALTSIDGYDCVMVEGALETTKTLRQDISSKINKDTSTVYTVSGWFKLVDYVAGTTDPFCGVHVAGYYDNDGTATWFGATGVSGSNNIVSYSDQGWVYSTYTFKFDQVPTEAYFYLYARDFTGTFYARNLKLEVGEDATDWSSSPDDTVKQVRFWAGTSYEERENAPWIVYSDGSMVSTKGTFSGVFTGEIEIGNISIIDPSKYSGNDAIVTIQNGDNGINRVQLRDTESSDFAQSIKITDNFYNESITLGQDGYGLFTSGVKVGDDDIQSILTEDTLTLNGSVIDGSTANTISMLPTTLNVGSASLATALNVYGETTLKNNLTVEGEIMIGDKIKIIPKSNGMDMEFIE